MIERTRDNLITFTKKLLGNKKSIIKLMLILIILLAALMLRISDSSRANAISNDIDADESINSSYTEEIIEEVYYVDIGGAVLSPGVYKVGRSTRLYEVIDMAGGLASNADTNAINRAAYVEDGEKIIVPELAIPCSGENSDNSLQTNPFSDVTSSRININYASKEELETLSGIGDAIANRIIEYRAKNKFKEIEDIKSVKGIGDKLFEKIKEHITV